MSRPYAVALCLLVAGATAAFATPTALNLVPTADVMGKHYLNVQLESDGYPTSFSRDSDFYFLTQYGLTDELEIGLDVWDLGGSNDFSVDAKWQFSSETERRPAMAIGAMNVGPLDCDTCYYLALSKTMLTPDTRLTIGLQSDGCRRGFFGFSHGLSDRCSVLADWTSGHEGFATLGVAIQVAPKWYVQPYYGWNTAGGGEDFMGLNVTWEDSLCCRE